MSRATKTERVRRTPINGTRNVLTVQGKDPNYEYRIVNDTGDRISQFQENGWELDIDSSIKVGDRRVANPTQEGSVNQTSVGGGVKGYVMRIKKEWHKEDQDAKIQQVAETEEGLRKEAQNPGFYGKGITIENK